ncbi:MAG: twin-arginine translocation signal domain-containing protein [Nitrospirota bacterium]
MKALDLGRRDFIKGSLSAGAAAVLGAGVLQSGEVLSEEIERHSIHT